VVGQAGDDVVDRLLAAVADLWALSSESMEVLMKIRAVWKLTLSGATWL
jgi:hypothetical protein